MNQMTTTRVISVATQYSTEPAGRFPEDGEFNGQRFREAFLVPALAQNSRVCVDFDGTEGYGSSFLEEAFGGLVRRAGFKVEELRERLEIRSTEDPSVVDEIWGYVADAKPEK